MECREIENILPGYVLGDLTIEAAERCRQHLETCADCRESQEMYSLLVDDISCEPGIVPTASESMALARALKKVRLCQPAPRRATVRSRLEMLGLAAASLIVFLFIATMLMLHAVGRIDMTSAIGLDNPLGIVLGFTVIIFITTFLPIAMFARRRPLNGMTFHR